MPPWSQRASPLLRLVQGLYFPADHGSAAAGAASMLQLLEYGIAVITTPMNRFHDHLHSRIAGSGPVRQLEQKEDHNSENEVVNDCQEIESASYFVRLGK